MFRLNEENGWFFYNREIELVHTTRMNFTKKTLFFIRTLDKMKIIT